jgi:hypothetical protein
MDWLKFTILMTGHFIFLFTLYQWTCREQNHNREIDLKIQKQSLIDRKEILNTLICIKSELQIIHNVIVDFVKRK